MANSPRFAGEKINLGGTEYTVPPLALGSIKLLQPKLEALVVDGVPSGEQIDNLIEIILAALNRNYPEMTVEELGALVDLGNVGALTKAVMRTSGLEQRTPEGNSAPVMEKAP